VWTLRIDGLVKEARARAGDPSSAPLWFEAGRIYESALVSLRDAAQHYQEAHKADPTFLPVVHAARRLFAQLGKWQMVVVLIDEELKLPSTVKAPLLFEKGRIHETKLGKPDVAVTLYRDALAFDPAYAPAVLAITRHLTASGDTKGVVDVLVQAAGAATNPRQKKELIVERARNEESVLKNDAAAIAAFEEARALDPQDRPTLDALRRLYATTGQQEEKLTGVLEALSRVAMSAGEIVPLELERARIFQKRGEFDHAIGALVRAREHGPADTIVLSELARLLEQQEQWPELVDVLVTLVQHTHDASV
jgi:tetratricopeptide (TPR) repeat protein